MIDAVGDEHLALEALWALYVSGGWNDALALRLLDHPSADVRAWTVRLIGDERRALPPAIRARLVRLAAERTEPHGPQPVGLHLQTACRRPTRCRSSRNCCAAARTPTIRTFRCCLWWAIEDKAISDRQTRCSICSPPSETWQLPLVRDTIVERLARRYLAEKPTPATRPARGCWRWRPRARTSRLLVAAMDKDFSGRRLEQVPAPLVEPLAEALAAGRLGPDVDSLCAAAGQPRGLCSAPWRGWPIATSRSPCGWRSSRRWAKPAEPDALAQLAAAVGSTIAGRRDSPGRAGRARALSPTTSIAREVLARYARFSPALRARAVGLLCSRRPWSPALVRGRGRGQDRRQGRFGRPDPADAGAPRRSRWRRPSKPAGAKFARPRPARNRPTCRCWAAC